MAWNSKSPWLLARPEVVAGRKVYRVMNEGQAPARGIEVTMRKLGLNGADLSHLLKRGRTPVELAPGASFLIGFRPDYRGCERLTIAWNDGDGDIRRWHGTAWVE